MTLLRDIPFDTPENTVKNILLILKEESDQLGAAFKCDTTRTGISVSVDMTITLTPRLFYLYLIIRRILQSLCGKWFYR